jgi:50S ribosomal protein L16 3-hydroxylase
MQHRRAFCYNTAMKKTPLSLLGGLTPTQFLRDYWHKKPLLIRQAISDLSALPKPAELFALAADADVESRLVSSNAAQWAMQNGPFETLPPTHQENWTLLVQSVNLEHDAADALLRQFRFLPDARLDDLMISYASNGGGVGPHFDSYDVFLLQTHGQRRWRIGAQQDLSLIPDLPLKILHHFQPDQEFILEPGDMLYLPPQYAHDGVAIGECMTCSIGFRAPSYQELGDAFLQFMADSIDLPGRYADPDLQASNYPAQISSSMVKTISSELNKVKFTADDVLVFLGEYLSEPKHKVFFEAPSKPLSLAQFKKAAAVRGVRLSRKTQMLYYGDSIFINGESFQLQHADKATLIALANERYLDGSWFKLASKDVLEALHTWYQHGWLMLIDGG